MSNSLKSKPFQLLSRKKKKLPILKLFFHQINLYDLQEWEDELREIVLRKYRAYNPLSHSGTPQVVKNTSFDSLNGFII